MRNKPTASPRVQLLRAPPLSEAPGPNDFATIYEDPKIGMVPMVRAVRVALAHSIREQDSTLATMIHPAQVQLSWQRVPDWLQRRFFEICTDLDIRGDELRDAVRGALFRNTREPLLPRRRTL